MTEKRYEMKSVNNGLGPVKTKYYTLEKRKIYGHVFEVILQKLINPSKQSDLSPE